MFTTKMTSEVQNFEKFIERLESLTTAVDKLIVSNNTLTGSHEQLRLAVNTFTESTTKLTANVNLIANNVKIFKTSQESKEREKNVIIYGLIEDESRSTKTIDLVRDLFNHFHIPILDAALTDAYRLGKMSDLVRPVIVKFVSKR